ncbi:MAG: hypothetical protein JO086_11200 [Acidimicrobiia bacterium]|nr:hypothetical protein [Acidimicrobiia bacterium]
MSEDGRAAQASPVLRIAGRSLPRGTAAVACGLLVLGVTSYGFLVISARALGPTRYAALSAAWAAVFLVGPGFFQPLEQEVARAVAARRVSGVPIGPIVRRSALLGALMVLVLVLVTVGVARPILRDLFDHDVLLLAGFAGCFAGFCCEHLARGVLAGTGRFTRYAVVIGGEGVVRIAACTILAVVGVASAGPYGLALGLAPFVAALFLGRAPGLTDASTADAPWGELSRALGYLLAGSVLSQFLVNAGPLAVKLLASSRQQVAAGHFLAGLVVTRVPLFLFASVESALLPNLSALATSGRYDEFFASLRRLVGFVVLVGAASVVGVLAAGPFVVRTLFGTGFDVGRLDLAYLAAGGAAYMLATTLIHPLIALHGHRRVAAGWLAGAVVFSAVTASLSGLLFRVEIGFLAGSSVAAASMGALLRPLLLRPPRTHADEAGIELPVVEP